MSEQELAAAVRDAASRLNDAANAAVDAGLRVEFDVMDARQFQDRLGRPFVSATVSKELTGAPLEKWPDADTPLR